MSMERVKPVKQLPSPQAAWIVALSLQIALTVFAPLNAVSHAVLPVPPLPVSLSSLLNEALLQAASENRKNITFL
jgi:hypothetical protein